MKFYIEYGCGCGQETMIIEAKSMREAQNYCYQSAVDNYDSYAGLHGIPSKEDVCEEYGIEDINSEAAEEAYNEEREMWLDYFCIEFDENNINHTATLEEFGVYEI